MQHSPHPHSAPSSRSSLWSRLLGLSGLLLAGAAGGWYYLESQQRATELNHEGEALRQAESAQEEQLAGLLRRETELREQLQQQEEQARQRADLFAEERARHEEAVSRDRETDALAAQQEAERRGKPVSLEHEVKSIHVSPDGSRYATIATMKSTDDKERFVLIFRDSRNNATIGEPIPLVSRKFCFSPDGKCFAVTESDNTITLRSTETLEPLCKPLAHSSGISNFLFSPDGGILAVGTCSEWISSTRTIGSLSLWNTTTGQKQGKSMTPAAEEHPTTATPIAFTPDGSRLIASHDSHICIWDVARTRQIGKTMNPKLDEVEGWERYHPVNSIALNADGSRLYVQLGQEEAEAAEGVGLINIWDTKTSRRLAEYVEEPDGLELAFTPDGSLLVSRKARSLIFRDVKTTEAAGEPVSLHASLSGYAFSPDGRILATIDESDTILFWDVKTRRQIGSPCLHDDEINTIAFSKDGKTLISCSRDKTLRFWKVPQE